MALHVAEATLAEFDDFTIDDEQPDAVVIGDLGGDWTFDRLNSAFRQLQAGAYFVAMQKNRYWQTEDGLTLDAGPFVAALEYATGRDAVLAGKPSAAFMGLPLTDVAVAGDDIDSDARGAMAAGAHGVLVRTGKFRRADLHTPGHSPDAVIDSLADLPALLGVA